MRRKCVTDHLINVLKWIKSTKHSRNSLDPMILVLTGTLTSIGRTLW